MQSDAQQKRLAAFFEDHGGLDAHLTAMKALVGAYRRNSACTHEWQQRQWSSATVLSVSSAPLIHGRTLPLPVEATRPCRCTLVPTHAACADEVPMGQQSLLTTERRHTVMSYYKHSLLQLLEKESMRTDPDVVKRSLAPTPVRFSFGPG